MKSESLNERYARELAHRQEMGARAAADRKAKAAARKTPGFAFKRAARKAVNAASNLHVEIVDGDVAPNIQGEGGGYCNSSHPTGSGYERSTLRVVVGRDWKV